MKKNISINISGIIFYIEEDCYDKLKSYLQDIYKYFASYEDSKEIIEDIDSRIAEIFYSKLTKQKQVIVAEDVEELIITMGSVSDFQAIEDDPAYQMTFDESEQGKESIWDMPTEDDFLKGGALVKKITKPIQEKVIFPEKKEKPKEAFIYTDNLPSYQEIPTEETQKERKRLYRDNKHKVLGGVAAGLAHYFNIDPIWTRLAFVFLTTGLFFIDAIPQTAVLLYIVMWMIVPKNDFLEENPNIRKLYRDPERGVLGGVCSGLAAYWGVNEITIRILAVMVLATFGTGFFAYIILWIAIPEAKTLTEKMEMEGQTINLKNIRNNIRENMLDKLSEEPEKNDWNKILFFPFYMIAIVLDKIKDILKPFVSFTAEAIRIGGGLILLLVSMAFTVALIASLFILWGWGMENFIQSDEISFSPEILQNSFGYSFWMVISTYITLFVPTLFIGLFGIMMLTRRIIWNNRFGWSIAGLWLISLIGTGVSVGMVVNDFRTEAHTETAQYFEITNKKLFLSLTQNEGDYLKPQLTLAGYEGENLKLVKTFISKGKNERDAQANALMLNYTIQQKDSLLLFDKFTTFKPSAKYRNQHLIMHLYIPYNREFVMSPEMADILYHTLTPFDYEKEDIEGNTWKFTEQKLVCITCNQTISTPQQDAKGADFRIQDFEGIEANGAFKLHIKQGDAYKVNVIGDENAFQNIDFEKDGNMLRINAKNSRNKWSQNLTILITLPRLARIDLSGVSRAKITGEMFEDLKIKLNGVAKVSIEGKAENLKVDLSGASKLEAFDLIAQEIALQVSGASKAYIFAQREIKAEVNGAGVVRYRGNPNSVRSETSGTGYVTKE